ncbi:MAG: NAD(P)H-hydrate epimerase [Lautropia sp.]|nr:NAD(P)H-hydrate epimerase [Lautropia sp.]
MANCVLTSGVFPVSCRSPNWLLDLKTIREIEARWLAETPPGALMACAGAAVAEVALKLWRCLPADTPVVLLVGPGNNGGDALVAGRLLRQQGLQVRAAVFPGLDRHPPSAPDARGAWVAWRATGEPFHRLDEAKAWLDSPALVIDGLFGIGLTRPLADDAAELAQWLAERREDVTVLSIDVPSGLNADTGGVVDDGAVVSADVTVTMIADKPGLHTGPGLVHAGEVWVAPLSVDPPVPAEAEVWPVRLDQAIVGQMLPEQQVDAHKGTAGDVLVMGGRLGMGGAARLAARGALGAGAGRVWIATEPASGASRPVGPVDPMNPEIMRWSWPVVAADDVAAPDAAASGSVGASGPEAVKPADAGDSGRGSCPAPVSVAGGDSAAPALADEAGMKLPGSYPVLVVGCGLGQDDTAHDWLEAALASTAPLVLDADALTLMAGSLADMSDKSDKANGRKETEVAVTAKTALCGEETSASVVPARPAPIRIMTPHPLEAARLLKDSVASIQADRIRAARTLARRFGACVVLKGAGTVVAAPDGRYAINSSGHPVLGAAGTGDVLAGTIGALLARLLRAQVPAHEAAWRAACLGVWLHGRAGELAARRMGPMGVPASALPAMYPMLISELLSASRS